jgi:hypothetical protein
MPKQQDAHACAIITTRQPKGRGGLSRPPPRRPLCARLRRLKRRAHSSRPRPRLRSLNDPVPYRVSVTATRREPRAQATRPSKGAITDQWPRDLLGESRSHRCPRIRRITDQQLEGRLSREPTNSVDGNKTEAPSCYPAMALLIKGSKRDPRSIPTGAPDQQSQGRRGHAHSSLSSSSQARGCPACRIEEPMRKLVEGSHRGRAFAPSAPSEWDRALPSTPT